MPKSITKNQQYANPNVAQLLGLQPFVADRRLTAPPSRGVAPVSFDPRVLVRQRPQFGRPTTANRPHQSVLPPQSRYPVTTLSDGTLVSRDPGIPGSPIFNAIQSNRSGLKIRKYDPKTDTTTAYFNDGSHATFGNIHQGGRLLTVQQVETARNIARQKADIASSPTANPSTLGVLGNMAANALHGPASQIDAFAQASSEGAEHLNQSMRYWIDSVPGTWRANVIRAIQGRTGTTPPPKSQNIDRPHPWIDFVGNPVATIAKSVVGLGAGTMALPGATASIPVQLGRSAHAAISGDRQKAAEQMYGLGASQGAAPTALMGILGGAYQAAQGQSATGAQTARDAVAKLFNQDLPSDPIGTIASFLPFYHGVRGLAEHWGSPSRVTAEAIGDAGNPSNASADSSISNATIRKAKSRIAPPNRNLKAAASEAPANAGASSDSAAISSKSGARDLAPNTGNGNSDNIQPAIDAISSTGVAPQDAGNIFLRGVIDDGLISQYQHLSDGQANIASRTDAHSVFHSPGEGVTVTPSQILTAHGDPVTIGHAADSMAGVTKDTQAQTARLAVPGEVVGANEALTTDVQLPLSPDQTPDQHVAVAHALATDPRLVDRNGNPMFADGTLFYTPDGEPQYHVNSLSNQQISGIDANDYVTDLASIIPAAKSVLEDHGVKPTIAVNQSIRSAPSIAEASPSTTIDLPNGEDNGAQSSNSDTNRPESYSETSGAPAPPGNALGSSHDLRGSFDKATADSVNTAVIKATSDPQGFVDQNGPSVSSPDNPPPDADMDATEEAPANAGASSVSNAEPGSSGATEDAPASQVEALKKAYGTDPDTLLAGIKKRKAANRTHADINDSDGSKLNDDIATYGAFKIAELNDSQKANFRSWQKSITDSLDSEDTKKIKKLWDASQDKHQRALAQTDPDMGAISSARSSLKGAKAQRPGRVPKAEKPPKVRAVDTGPSSVAATGAKMPVNPKVYSTAFEMQLKRIDFGRGRQVHFNRANEALHNAIMADPEFAAMMEKLSPGVTERVSKSGGRRDPVGFTWEHASSTTASGRVGVMRLVPREQHTPGSLWWRVLHPDVGARGGYYEWARPNGAPKNKVRRRK